ncbi:alkaline phosphatase, tissue-nonspecific isozyme-like isoform X2 [Rhipicephalus microplus]|uniref:alkaline phosphatase, tissue-nonspecific isozyme-like isoform X2 n=1 Tax=Rhipicephalus microplus TaxID=6941 RepID=UPI003F6D20D0
MSRVLLFVATILQVSYAEFPVPNKQNEANRSYWERLGDEIIQEKLSRQPVTNLAKNVVLFLGDGMGVSTVTAARIYKGQSKYNNSGEEYVLSWERFPYVALSKTYGLDTQTSDSANSATAYLCGVKANMGTLGVDSTVKAKQCHNDSSAYVDSIMQWAQDAGKWTGIVTTTAVTDATPAGSYAHSGYRRWQYDVPKGCNASDIAQQLILNSPGKNMRVILGAGRKVFFNSTEYDEECKKGARIDGLNLINVWQAMKNNTNASYVWNRSQLLAVETNSTDYLLGLFDNEQMPYWLNRSEPNSTKPNLTEMVTVALKILSKAPKGFVLLVEGGRIDHAHHANRAKLALQETLEFDEAVHKTVRTLPENETLYVVTADHSHTMSIAGHPSRGTNILGLAGNTTLRREPKSTYTVLSYAVGPGYRERENYTEEETSSDDFLQQSTYPLWSATHGGEDVAVYAKGPWAHLFDGVNDQTYIPYVMAYASCIGQFNGSKCHQYNA